MMIQKSLAFIIPRSQATEKLPSTINPKPSYFIRREKKTYIYIYIKYLLFVKYMLISLNMFLSPFPQQCEISWSDSEAALRYIFQEITAPPFLGKGPSLLS